MSPEDHRLENWRLEAWRRAEVGWQREMEAQRTLGRRLLVVAFAAAAAAYLTGRAA